MEEKSELQIPPEDLNCPRGLGRGLAAHSGQICEQAPGQVPGVPAGHRASSQGTARHQLSTAATALGLHKALGSEQHQDFSAPLPLVGTQHAQLVSGGG